MMCRGAMTLDNLFMTSHGYLAMTAPCPVVVSSREIRYVHKKWPNSQVLRFSSPAVAHQYMAQTRYLPTPQPVSHLVNGLGQVSLIEDTTSALYCVNRDMSRFFGIPYEEIQIMSSLHGSGQIHAYWSEGLTNLTTNTGGDLLGREEEPNRHNAIEGVFVAPAMRRAQESRRVSPTRRTPFEEALGITSDSMERWMASPSRGRPNGLTVSARQFSVKVSLLVISTPLLVLSGLMKVWNKIWEIVSLIALLLTTLKYCSLKPVQFGLPMKWVVESLLIWKQITKE